MYACCTRRRREGGREGGKEGGREGGREGGSSETRNPNAIPGLGRMPGLELGSMVLGFSASSE